MAGYKRDADAPGSEDRALELFAEMMIEKIETLDKDWTQPWFTNGVMSWPKNLYGREYNGMNALLLMMHCEKNGYEIPRFCTFDCIRRFNKEHEEGKGENQERVSILKGEKSFPVMLTTFTVVDKETRQKIKYDDYKNLSDVEKERYNVYPKLQVFRVFNVAQTNLRETRPALWERLVKESAVPERVNQDGFAFEPVDRMIKDDLWICPIRPKYQDDAYFSISKNEIVVPEKKQFKNSEAYYGTLFHEMVHSTGAKDQLDRFKPSQGFGSPEYAREELVAELGSALISQRYGMTKNIKEDSVAYLKSWLTHLQEYPQYLKTTLLDVKKASSMITQKIDRISMELQQNDSNGKEIDPAQEKTFYSSVAYLQSADDTARFEELKDKQDYDGILNLAREYYDGDGVNGMHTYTSPTQNRGDSVLVEDKDFIVVYNGTVGGTFDIMKKFTEQDVRNYIDRYGVDDAGEALKEVAKDMAAEQFSAIAKEKIPAFEMPGGELLYLDYNRQSDTLDAGTVTNAGFTATHHFAYDHNASLDMNLQEVHEKLLGMDEYSVSADIAESTGVLHR